jgi:hypothetical protein
MQAAKLPVDVVLPETDRQQRVSEWRSMPLADQLHAAASCARTTRDVDHFSSLLWKAHAALQIGDSDAAAISEALQARKYVLAMGASSKVKTTVLSQRRKPPRTRPGAGARRCSASVALAPSTATLSAA